MTKRILITGGTGFVGRQVVRALSKQDISIRLIVRDLNIGIPEFPANGCEIVTSKDLFDESPTWWEQQCKGIDTVIHVAWYAEPGKYLQSSKNMDCIVGSLNLARGAVKSGIKRFVGVGTCFEYDVSVGVLTTDTPLKPTTPYAGAKAALYLGLEQWLKSHSVEFAWCRLFYLFGEGEDPRRLVPYLRSQLGKGAPAELTSGKQIRDFIDVADAGGMIADVALGDRVGAVNICSGIPVTVSQLANKIADEYGRRDLLRFNRRKENEVDPPCVVGVN